jgi:subtilisin family serine protease
VAIISSVPGGGYAAWDGTSMAAPHLTGLLALVAADARFAAMPRDAAKVERLFKAVLASATDIGLDRPHGGFGVPSVAAALAPVAASAARPASAPAPASTIASAQIAQIVEAIVKGLQTLQPLRQPAL